MIYPFKTIDQLKAPPYTELPDTSQILLRETRRIVYCQYCKYSVETILYGAKCGQCHSFLISNVSLVARLS